MLLASSVATIATRPAVSSSNASSRACDAAWRRASAVSVARSSGMITSFPTGQSDGRPGARFGFDGEVVDQAARAAEPEPEPAAARVAVAQRAVDVGDAGPAVGEAEPQAVATMILERLEEQLAAAAVDHGVPRAPARAG